MTFEINEGNGMGIVSITTLVFFILKCVGLIYWSWWWVFSPMLISAGIGIILLVFALIILGIIVALE